jgi:predicted ATP-grasp superfamily ATP-dependent carboligase
MSHITWMEQPELHEPLIVAAFTGWNDAGDAASLTVRHLIAVTGAKKIGCIDPDEFYDFQSSRPQARFTNGARVIVWPTVEIYAASTPAGDLLLLIGGEPQMRWQTFCREFTQLAATLKASMVVTFGALLADVPHTRPTNVIVSSSHAECIEKYGLGQPTYEGPTGIVGVLSAAFGQCGVPAISLWAAVPSYVSNTASPKAALALLARFSVISPRPLMLDGLQKASREYERDVTCAVDEDDDLVEYVQRLEHLADHNETEDINSVELPDNPAAAEEFVSEVEKFLRDQNG